MPSNTQCAKRVIDICSQGADFKHMKLYSILVWRIHSFRVIVIINLRWLGYCYISKRVQRDMRLHVRPPVDYAYPCLSLHRLYNNGHGSEMVAWRMWIDVADDFVMIKAGSDVAQLMLWWIIYRVNGSFCNLMDIKRSLVRFTMLLGIGITVMMIYNTTTVPPPISPTKRVVFDMPCHPWIIYSAIFLI